MKAIIPIVGRLLLAITPLMILTACSSTPTTKLVAGTYDLAYDNGAVEVFELAAGGEFKQTLQRPGTADSVSTGTWKIRGYGIEISPFVKNFAFEQGKLQAVPDRFNENTVGWQGGPGRRGVLIFIEDTAQVADQR